MTQQDDWEGGEIVLLAYAVAVDRYGDCWWHDMNWATWARAWEKNRLDAEKLDPDYGFTPLPKPRELSPEEKAARDRATDEELLAFERELYGPFWYVERHSVPTKPEKRPRKSRKKPVFWSPKKAD